MAAAPLSRVRNLSGAYHPVRLVPRVSSLDVKEAIIAGAVGLAVGTSFLNGADGGMTVLDSTQTADWTAVLLPAPPATLGVCIAHLAS